MECKLSSSAPSCPFFFSEPSLCTGSLRFGAMAVLGHRGGPQASEASAPHLDGTALTCRTLGFPSGDLPLSPLPPFPHSQLQT